MHTVFRLGVFGSIATATLGLLVVIAQPASANPAFAAAARQPCSACHISGREMEAPNSGYTPVGQAVYNEFIGNCSYKMDCAIAAGFGGSSTGPRTTATADGTASFSDTCGGSGDFYVIRLGGSPNNVFRFALRNGNGVQIQVRAGSTYAGQCGGFPGSGANFDYMRID